MSENNQHRVNFALVKVITEQLDLSEKDIEETRKIKINAALNFGIDNDKKLIKVRFKNSFASEEKISFITIETGCVFAIDPESWKMFASQKQNLFVIPKNFAGHLASITAHTARGILHNATENTPLNRFLIPANNIEEMVKEHVAVPLQGDESA